MQKSKYICLTTILFFLFFLNTCVRGETVCCAPQTSCNPCPDYSTGSLGCDWIGPNNDQYCCDCVTGTTECQSGETRCHPYDDEILQDCFDGTWHSYIICPNGCFMGECLPPPQSCGDGICDSDENCETCPEDCGSCVSNFPDIEEFKPADVTVQPGKIIVTFYLMNTDNIDMSLDKDYLIEVQPRELTGGLSAWVKNEEVCNPNNPENVHREYHLGAGDSIQFEITCPVSAGTYDVYMISTDGCCVDTNGNSIPCSFTDPYGTGKFLGRITVGEEGDINVHQTKRTYHCDDEACVYTDTDEIKEFCSNGCSNGQCIVLPTGTISLEMIGVIIVGSVSIIAILVAALIWL